MQARIINALDALMLGGYVELFDRPLAVAVFRAAQQAPGLDNVRGGSHRDEAGGTIYVVQADPPLCDGGCGGRTGSPTGMCYQCQCEAHADGWYDMDAGYVRTGTDEDTHLRLEWEARHGG